MKIKWYLSRSFVRKIVRASVCASCSYLYLPSRVPSFISAPHSHKSSFLLTYRRVRRHHCVLHRRLFNTERATSTSLRSSWPYATTKLILKITFEFRVCAPRDEHEMREKEREVNVWGEITFAALCMDHWPLKKIITLVKFLNIIWKYRIYIYNYRL